MMEEGAGDAVVVLMRVIAGREVQTQDVMEDELAEEMTSVDVVEIEMISADETIEEMIETLVIEDVMIEASEAAGMIEGMCYILIHALNCLKHKSPRRMQTSCK